MADSKAQNHPPSPEALALGYEPSALRIRAMAVFLVFFALSLCIVWFATWKLMKAMLNNERNADLPRSVVADQQPPPPPRIQPSVSHDSLPYQDMEAMRENEDSVFAKLGWAVDSKTHQVAIPDAVFRKVQQREAVRPAGPASMPTASPRGANTILPGAPTTQNIHETGGSPQGPTPNERLDLSDKPTTAGSGGSAHGPRPERTQP